jgi:hypothetical protein
VAARAAYLNFQPLVSKTNTMKIHLQQGDVALERIAKLPKNLKPVKADPRGIVLAEGEVTGHHHRIALRPLVELLEGEEGRRFLVNNSKSAVELLHEEHNPIVIEPGIYEVGAIHEMDHLAQMEREIGD